MRKAYQLYYPSPGVKKISIQKSDWHKPKSLDIATVELSARMCRFEWEGGKDFHVGEELMFHLTFPKGGMSKKGAILSCEECGLLDDDYRLRTVFLYRARFDDDLTGDLWRYPLVPRKCKSRFQRR